MADVIIIGGGLAGTVVASRLHQRRPELSIILFEAGPDASEHPHVEKPAAGALLHFSELDYKYFTVPQRHLDGKPKYNCAVKALGGGTVINYGGWMRGDRSDYDEWAQDVNDKRWSYEGLLPYFKRCETHHDINADHEQHGFDGPMYTASVSSSGRNFPLRDTVLKMWQHLGLEYKTDLNDGAPQSISDLVENWRDGKRQIAPSTYSLDGVIVVTEKTVFRIIVNEDKVATGVALVNGEVIELRAGGQMILSAGAYNTPKVLMLSGIGDAKHLARHGIELKIDLPLVGQDLHDHLIFYRYWKLRHPERGLAVGSPLFNGPNHEKGGPVDFIVRAPIGSEARTHLEHGMLYAPFGAEAQGMKIPADGSTVCTFAMACLPTSRGSVTLASKDPHEAPVIEPNYLATREDKQVLREAFKTHSRLMLDTTEGREIAAGEHVPEGYVEIGLDAKDEEIDARIKVGASTTFHPGGTAAMGKVVDSSLKVFGMKNLRVVDASVIPKPLATHYQAPLYAIAEQAVDILVEDCFRL